MLDKKLVIEVMQKAARCWAGYEPVPGAKAYSEGSCRPKGSKKTKKEVIQGKNHTEKKAAKPYTGQHSATPFDAPHAAGLLGMKPDANPQQVYNRLMHQYQAGKFNPAQFSELRAKYQGLPPSFTQPTAAAAPTAPKPAQAPVARRPSPCGPGGCPVPRQVIPPVQRTPAGVPRLVPGVPQPRPTMNQMPAKTAKVDFTRFAPKAAPPAKPAIANATRKPEEPPTLKPEPLPRVAPTVPPVDAKVPPLK